MKQQVNLYQPIFRHRRPLFSALALLQVVGMIALGLGAVYGYSAWQVSRLAQQMTHLEQSRDAAVAQLEALRARYPTRAASPLLQAEIARLKTEISGAQAVASALNTGALGNTAGLSTYLAGLARQHVVGTWLTKVEITNGGTAIGVYGQATRPEFVPQYMTKLTAEPAFAGKTFSSLKLKQLPAPAAVEFSIETDGVQTVADQAPARPAG